MKINYDGSFDQFIDELQAQFIFSIRQEASLMEKLRRLWVKNNPQTVDTNDQQ